MPHSGPSPSRHSHKGLLAIVGFDAADVVRCGAAQHVHQPFQGGFELQRTSMALNCMVRASRNILGLVGFPRPGHTQVLLGAVLAPVVRGQHTFPPSSPHTWLEMDFLLFWLLGSDLRLGRPAILGPLDLRDCRDVGPSPSSRKSSASRADCTEQSCESQADIAASFTPYQESHHHQETAPGDHELHRGQPSARSSALLQPRCARSSCAPAHCFPQEKLSASHRHLPRCVQELSEMSLTFCQGQAG